MMRSKQDADIWTRVEQSQPEALLVITIKTG